MRVFFIVCLLLTTSCASTQSKLNGLRVGMTKQEVIQEMGDPVTTQADADSETLVYKPNLMAMEGWAFSRQYWVILKDGKVTRYGNAKDLKRSAASQ